MTTRRNQVGLGGNGGLFAPTQRLEEQQVSLGLDDVSGSDDLDERPVTGYVNDMGAWTLGHDGDGTCPNCGHNGAPGETCESCSPTCTECGAVLESADYSLCDYCQERENENAYWDDEED